jgi:hypothetical protein
MESKNSVFGFVVISVVLLVVSFDTVQGNGMHNIHWNSSNPLFNPRGENIIQVNGGNHPWEYDQVNIVCPVYKAGTSEAIQEKYIIYSVSNQEYDSCRITQPNPRIIAVCDRPHELMYFTITFRSFTPTPGGLEFRPGQSYYFISTSSKSDIHRRVGGGCSTHSMKITFKVADELKKSVFTIDEKEENTLEGDLNPRHFMRKAATFAATEAPTTLYYPLREMAQVKQFFYKKKQDFFTRMQGDDPSVRIAVSSSSSLLLSSNGMWELLSLFLITSYNLQLR